MVGQTFKLVGNAAALGAWNHRAAPSFTWSDDHIWQLSVKLPTEELAEFKIVQAPEDDGDGEWCIWQEGENTIVDPVALGLQADGAIEVGCTWAGEARAHVIDAPCLGESAAEMEADKEQAGPLVEDCMVEPEVKAENTSSVAAEAKRWIEAGATDARRWIESGLQRPNTDTQLEAVYIPETQTSACAVGEEAPLAEGSGVQRQGDSVEALAEEVTVALPLAQERGGSQPSGMPAEPIAEGAVAGAPLAQPAFDEIILKLNADNPGTHWPASCVSSKVHFQHHDDSTIPANGQCPCAADACM
jgi:hypothetical protein